MRASRTLLVGRWEARFPWRTTLLETAGRHDWRIDGVADAGKSAGATATNVIYRDHINAYERATAIPGDSHGFYCLRYNTYHSHH